MNDPVVADSACLISLERIDQIGLLPALFETIMIPPEAEREFGTEHDWLRVETPQDANLVNSLKLMLDHGEAEAIALAVERALGSYLMIGRPGVWPLVSVSELSEQSDVS